MSQIFHEFIAAIAFYSTLPMPHGWCKDFRWAARWVVAVGLVLGSILTSLDFGLSWLGMSSLSRSSLVVAVWVGLTGGLHLDGAMDAADGLAVQDPSRRLAVMADSATGAFGAMSAIIILLLKTSALNDLNQSRWLILVLVMGWSRWGQMVAIARYPYLKPTGKGAFHHHAVNSFRDTIPSGLILLLLSGMTLLIHGSQWWLGVPLALGLMILGPGVAYIIGAWFNHQLGGHTGDTYGAVVEWTESLLLIGLTLID
ncbi:MAG: adenosylcobinamide-GDP ribazoletransferase [Cyanobacteria bacterium WB6_1B_304]|nr:adenosylcobinamide-GDP ribazoletransferase [Cyanobacteria bacterium WB6_1B_304]